MTASADKSDTVQQIKDRLSIVDVVGSYVKLERSGVSWRARCPFHNEKTPSFYVSPERGTYHCFGCNLGGDIFSFVQQIEGLDFKGALKQLAERAGVEVVYSRAGGGDDNGTKDRLLEAMEAATLFYGSRMPEVAASYLRERGVSDGTIHAFRLGYAGNGWTDLAEHLKRKGFSDKEALEAGLVKKNERGSITDKFRNRIMFPINDSVGRPVAFSGRIFGADASPEAPKYLNSPETALFHKSRILYGFDRAKQSMRKHNCAVLVEGQMDLLAMHQAGWTNTVAVSGTAFTEEHTKLIKRFTDNLILALDADQAGIKAASRAAHIALALGMLVKVAQFPDGLDPADVAQQKGSEAIAAVIRGAKDIIIFLLDVLQVRNPAPDIFRRHVEAGVLPFLSDIQSPIAREQYIRQIAQRLGVSEAAVAASVPQGHVVSSASPYAPVGRLADTRARNAFALLLWQESLNQPNINVVAYAKELEESVGDVALAELRALPEDEQESLRFRAEHLYAKAVSLETEARTLARLLLHERLTRELASATAALRMEEALPGSRRDEAKITDLTAACHLLTTRIAQLLSVV